MSLLAILVLGFFLGMRHATDADHVVAVSTVVSRERSLRAAAPIGMMWGLGHTLTIVIVGGAILVFGLVIPPKLGLGLELSVAFMLVVLGGFNLLAARRGAHVPQQGHAHVHDAATSSLRPLAVGIVHGLAGSAAIALLVLGTVSDPFWGLAYLLVFGAGTIAGMLLVTTAFALPMIATAQRFERFHRWLGTATGVGSVAFGILLAYRIGFVQGLFTGHPIWTPG